MSNALQQRDWMGVAKAAVEAYHSHERYAPHGVEFPKPYSVGMCAMAARCLWSAVHGGERFPFGAIDANGDGHTTANDILALMKKAGAIVTMTPHANAYHVAAAEGRIKPGALLFYDDGYAGHVNTVVAVNTDPAASVVGVEVFENTSGVRRRSPRLGPGTIITPLALCLGGEGTSRIIAVGNWER